MSKAKPFIKWVGGKGQLLPQLAGMLPAGFGRLPGATYVEPFAGGGAMLFHMLAAFPNIGRAVINDINPSLARLYATVRDQPEALIGRLRGIEAEYRALPGHEERRGYYLRQRGYFNQLSANGLDDTRTKNGTMARAVRADIERSALFVFLNRTCFNGLYRVNSKGAFNVPFGRYASPTICDAATLLADSEALRRVEILCGDFEATLAAAAPGRGTALFYLDPPYRPLSATSSFNSYAREPFDDDAQARLRRFCGQVDAAGHRFMLSNSDDGQFFDRLYSGYHIHRVQAARSVNSVGAKRGKISEILVTNYLP